MKHLFFFFHPRASPGDLSCTALSSATRVILITWRVLLLSTQKPLSLGSMFNSGQKWSKEPSYRNNGNKNEWDQGLPPNTRGSFSRSVFWVAFLRTRLILRLAPICLFIYLSLRFRGRTFQVRDAPRRSVHLSAWIVRFTNTFPMKSNCQTCKCCRYVCRVFLNIHLGSRALRVSQFVCNRYNNS